MPFEVADVTKLNALTFSLDIPDDFPETRVFLETARAETYAVPYVLQNPEFNCGLERTEDLVDRPGETFFERCLSRIHDFGEELEVTEPVTLQIHGHPAVYQEGSVTWAYGDKVARVHYFVGGVMRSDEHCYTFKAYCESDVVDQFRSVFVNIWQSLDWFGDAEVALDERDQTLSGLNRESNRQAQTVPVVKDFVPPGDGQPYFRVGEHLHRVSVNDLKAEICSSSKVLSVTIGVKPEQAMPNFEEVVEYPEEDLGFRLHFSNICKAGIPTGEFDFEAGRSDDRNTYLWDDGWAYSLQFFGRATLKDGWIALVGAMKEPYETTPNPTEIELFWPLPIETLEWSNYRFKSVDETSGMQDNSIRYLHLEETHLESFPQRVLDFSALEELTISGGPQYPGQSQRLSLSELPEQLGELTALRTLHINGTGLSSLPDAVGGLRNLEHLSITHSNLKTTPPSLWTLPSLKHLILFHNQLVGVAESGQLPSLVSLHLHDNKLTTLPTWIVSLPNIRYLYLENNPWESLPEEVLDVEETRLEFGEKMRLFDYTYKSVDGIPPGVWEDEKFFLRSEATRWRSFTEQLEQNDFNDYQEALKTVCKNTLYFEPLKESTVPRLGETRFGGLPDLPKGWAYPCSKTLDESFACEFLAQLNCRDLAPLQEYLPREGFLYFFIDHQENCAPVVLYHSGPVETLQTGADADFPSNFFNLPDGPYSAHRVAPQLGWSLPSDYAYYCNKHYFPDSSSVLAEQDGLTDEITEAMLGFEPQHRHEVNGYVFTQHESPELQAALKLRGRPQDWVVLLKIASLGDFQWSDAGDLFFVIHKSDLENSDFRNVYCGLESS